MYCSRAPETALGWAKIFAKIGVFNIAPLIYAFSVHWLGLYAKQKKVVIAGFVLAAFFYVLTLTTPYGLAGVRHYFWGYYPMYGPICKIFLAFFTVYFFAAFRNFFVEWRKAQDPDRSRQIKIITIAYLISFTGSVDYIPKVINLPLYPFGYFSVLVWILIVAFAIVRYRIMDIQTVIHKTIMWVLTSAIFGVPFVFIFFQARRWLLQLHPIAFLGIIAGLYFTFILYTRFIQPRIDHIFQRRHWDLIKALEKFTDELVHLRNLNEVISHILDTVKKVFYLDHVSFLIRENDQFFRVDHATEKSMRDYPVNHAFLQWLEANDKVVIREYLDIDPRLKDIAETAKAYLDEMNSYLCVPLTVNRQLIGVLNLGQKQNLQPYRSHDINFLSDLRRSAAIALANALHIIAMQENLRKWNEELEKKVDERTKQLQETQAQLVQAEKLATIGTLAGGVAHEINNPLTAVLTNAQILKMSANQDDLESLDLIEEGAKRCQLIIQNLLKYSRKTTMETPHAEVDLCSVVQNTTALLAYQFKQENIEINLDLKSVPSIPGISNELEQVLTNFLINARDAIRQANRPGKIAITIRRDENHIELKVQDNGIGMSREVIGKIFDPFFTTKEVGRGTGLGLAVSYEIVQKHHGKIVVNSEEGMGATFLIRFPIQ